MAPVANGFLIPPWYHDMRATAGEFSNEVSSVIWGFSLGCALFSLGKMIRQTVLAYRRNRLFNIYIVLIWSTWTATTSLSFISWLYLQNILPARSAFFPWTARAEGLTDLGAQFLDLSGNE